MAAPLRTLGSRLLRKQHQIMMCPRIVKTMSPTFRQQATVQVISPDVTAPRLFTLLSKRGVHHSVDFPPRVQFCPLYRTVHMTKCSLSNCLTPSRQSSRVVKPHSFVVQKLSMGTSSSENKTPPWFHEVRSYLDKSALKLWRGICQRIESEIVTWVIGIAISACCLLGTIIYKGLGIEDKSTKRLESQENKDAIKGLSDTLDSKDKRYEALEKVLKQQVAVNDKLRKEHKECAALLKSLAKTSPKKD